jgi:hypothetical protein
MTVHGLLTHLDRVTILDEAEAGLGSEVFGRLDRIRSLTRFISWLGPY